jgi:hypothetical protein
MHDRDNNDLVGHVTVCLRLTEVPEGVVQRSRPRIRALFSSLDRSVLDAEEHAIGDGRGNFVRACFRRR